MTNRCDYNSAKAYTLAELAAEVGAVLRGSPDVEIRGIGPLENARPDQLTFLTHNRFIPLLNQCRAAALIVSPSFKDLDYPLLICDRPYVALARIAQLFFAPPAIAVGIHPNAYVESDVQVGPEAAVGALAHIGAGSRIGRETRIYDGAYLGRRVRVGEQCLIYPGVVVLDDCSIGNRVIIHSGTVIGSDGFGYAQDQNGSHLKIPQLGTVRIDDGVEIGANCTIDRATFGHTWIQRGSKIDNLVHIAHNVVVGEDSILVAQVGIAGSTRIGKNVVLAGQVGVVGHIEIGDGVRVGAQSGVPRSIEAGQDVSGSPAVPHREWLQMCAGWRRLPKLREEIRQLQRKIDELEKKVHGE
jgi:UDP-3-O-[3-hydroxymyristoyl] glucosamine N-acyltransferase